MKEATVWTSTDDFEEYLEYLIGGPLRGEQEVQATVQMAHQECDMKDFKEQGFLRDVETEIDDRWRKETRIKKV